MPLMFAPPRTLCPTVCLTVLISHRIPGALLLCSKCLLFDPQDQKLPMYKFSFEVLSSTSVSQES